MADIYPYTNQIRTARYGEQVRSSIADAIIAINEQVENDTESAHNYAEQAGAYTDEVKDYRDELSGIVDAEASRVNNESQRVAAEAQRASAEAARENTETGYVAQARSYAEQAADWANSNPAILAKSWAVGGTGSREGENLDNAKYWAGQARAIAGGDNVLTFNGRNGIVIPGYDAEGNPVIDYTSSQIGHGTGTVASALSNTASTLSSISTNLSALDSKTTKNIDETNGNIFQLSAKYNPGHSYTTYDTVKPVLTMLHFSDIHNDQAELQYIVDYYNRHSDAINDIICTGDMISYWYRGDRMDYWDAVAGSNKIMTVIGNHDALQEGTSGSSGWPREDMATLRERFMYNINSWNAVPASDTSTYYYKDYDDQGIRLIVLDCTLVSGTTNYTDQMTWFTNTLTDARNNSKAVVIAEHYEPQNPTKFACDFTSEIRTFDTGSGWVFYPAYQEAVKSFINAGGEFICYLAGHQHCDFVCYNSSYPNQLFINITSALPDLRYGDQMRMDGTSSDHAFNLIAFDTTAKLIKIQRIGADSDYQLRPRRSLILNYSKCELVRQDSSAFIEHKVVDYTAGSRYSEYIKFGDGTLICVVEKMWTGKTNSHAWGSLYYSNDVDLGEWPYRFTGTPYTQTSLQTGADGILGSLKRSNSGSQDRYVGKLCVMSGDDSSSDKTFGIVVIGYGRWKN